MELKNFDAILERAGRLPRPMRVVVAGSENENILKGVFKAQSAGFASPVLVGDKGYTLRMLKELGLSGQPYEMIEPKTGEDPVQIAIDIINGGGGDVLMRGNTQTREFLMPVLDRKNGLRTDKYMSHVSLAHIPDYKKLIALSDVTVIISPDMNRKKAIIANTVEALNAFGYERPKVALLSLVESASFHMKDSVEAMELAEMHRRHPIADCELVGPIAYDLIMSREAARLKGYTNPHCEDFDAIIAPNLLTGNVLVKSWLIHAKAVTCGAVVGARIPIALTSRSSGEDETFMSLAFCAVMVK